MNGETRLEKAGLEKTESEREGLFWQIPLQFWAPLFLLSTLVLASGKQIPFDLLAISLVGFYFCSRWHLRGCVYALILLGLGASLRHCFIGAHHLWELGIEGSLGCAFFIASLAFEQDNFLIQSMESHIESGRASLENIEEEMSKEREASVAIQAALHDKIGALQKELEEIQSEHSSFLILNEVLRKTTAKHMQDHETLAESAVDLQHRTAVLQRELQESQKELARVKGSDGLAIENQKLMKELNAARYEKQQTHLINETLARLHARENLKVKESADRIETIIAEKMQMQERLQAELVASRTEAQIYSGHHEQAAKELDRTRNALKDLSEVHTQKNFLQERLLSAEGEIAVLRQKISQPQSDPRALEKIESLKQERQQLAEQLAHAQEKMHTLSQIEPLFKQLKKQFEEKDQILHQTRSQLFVADTELQKLQMERNQAALQFNPVPKEVGEEMEALDQQIEELEEENRELQELIAILSSSESPAPASKRKKKVKTPSADQDLLF